MTVRVRRGWRPRHKFNARATTLDGFRFDSRAEGRYYERLKLRQEAGEVIFFLRQVPFHLPGGVVLRVDFVEFLADGTVRVVDVKGIETESFMAKKRMVEAIYPVEIEVEK